MARTHTASKNLYNLQPPSSHMNNKSGKKNTKVVLINMPVPMIEDDVRQPPGSLVTIATYAVLHGYDVSVMDFSGKKYKEIIKQIPAADVYGFSVYSVTYKDTIKVVKVLRQRRNSHSFFVAGGPHATALPEEVKRHFDCVVCGEGEETFRDILDSFESGNQEQFKTIIRAKPIQNLDQLPFPDYYSFCDLKRFSRKMLVNYGGIEKEEAVLCLDSSRGCNYKCRFCNSRVSERGKWRARSAESVTEEINWHYSKGYNSFRFNDDNFLVDRNRALEICKKLSPLNITFRIFARAESLLDPKLCKALYDAGCRHVSVGIESLSSRMLARMGKATRVLDILLGLKQAHDANIRTRGYFICGFPGETDETIAKSIESLNGIALDEAMVYPCIPYPGTPLFADPVRFGIKKINPDFTKYVQIGRGRSAGFVMETETFGPEQIAAWRDFYFEAFQKHNIMLGGGADGPIV